MAIAVGLFQLFTPTTSQAMWVGITFLAGLGGGAAFLFSFIASQTVAKFNQLELEIGGGIVSAPSTRRKLLIMYRSCSFKLWVVVS